MQFCPNRRQVLHGAGLAAAISFGGQIVMANDDPRTAAEPFGYCLNTGTLRGHKLPFAETVDIAIQAGYQGLEPWLTELRAHVESGGKLADLAKRMSDAGMTVESVIGFAEWIVDDDQQRAQGLDQAKRDMEIVQQIGGKRLAAPPAGATKLPTLDLYKAADRYRKLIEVGADFGVVPQLELWGFSASLKRLSEVLFVATECGHEKACVLLDVYHLYKGGTDFESLRMLNGRTMHVLHMNDYPANPPRDMISDAHRVYPGDGIAPLNAILRTLRDQGFRGTLSLELFNRDYWSQDPVQVARTGLEKMRVAVVSAELG